MATGRVSCFDYSKGIGMIRLNNPTDLRRYGLSSRESEVMINHESGISPGFKPYEEERVVFDVIEGTEGLTAVNIRRE